MKVMLLSPTTVPTYTLSFSHSNVLIEEVDSQALEVICTQNKQLSIFPVSSKQLAGLVKLLNLGEVNDFFLVFMMNDWLFF